MKPKNINSQIFNDKHSQKEKLMKLRRNGSYEGNGYNTVQLKTEGMNGYSWKMREGMDTTGKLWKDRIQQNMREGMDTTGKWGKGMDTAGKWGKGMDINRK